MFRNVCTLALVLLLTHSASAQVLMVNSDDAERAQRKRLALDLCTSMRNDLYEAASTTDRAILVLRISHSEAQKQDVELNETAARTYTSDEHADNIIRREEEWSSGEVIAATALSLLTMGGLGGGLWSAVGRKRGPNQTPDPTSSETKKNSG